MNWMIFKVSPNHEFKVAAELRDIRVSARVPKDYIMRRFGLKGQQRQAEVPLIRGYVFASFDKHTPRAADLEDIEHLHGVLRRGFATTGEPVTVTSADLERLDSLAKPLASLGPAPKLNPGDRIPIRKGAWATVDMIVDTIRGTKVVGWAELFGKRHRVSVPIDAIQMHPPT